MVDLQYFFDQFPDQDELKPFDGFFVGEESSKLVNKVPINNYYDQLYNSDGSDSGFEDITDWEDFDGEYIKVENLEEVFFEAKKGVYDLFGYIDKKMSESKLKLVRVKDLVITSVDKRLIEYLSYKVDDYYTIYSIAELSAFKEIGYDKVRFRSKDGCPICNALDKNVFTVQEVIDKLVEGESISHKSCDCFFEPFGKYYGICDIVEEGIEIIGCPVEWKEVVVEKFKSLGYDYLVFGDAERAMKYDGLKNDLGAVTFMVQKEGKKGLFIDRSFVGFDNAIDFMDAAKFERVADIFMDEGVDYIDPSELQGEVYIHKDEDGSIIKIVSYDNPVTGEYEFRNAETGELLEI